ncbi:MAG TPA: XdhC family protein, partial [Acidovorax temperans]|nr:XdhC family protein [Acidovorax temperans]
MTDVGLLVAALNNGATAWLVSVKSTEGSAPREPGAWMAVLADRVIGTIGGGHLEHQAMADARRRLAGEPGEPQVRYALGPALGQCCGGVVHLRFEPLGPADAASLPTRLQGSRVPVALFGGGHVGHALARVLAPLPFALTWIDSRDGIFPPHPPEGVVCEHSE